MKYNIELMIKKSHMLRDW